MISRFSSIITASCLAVLALGAGVSNALGDEFSREGVAARRGPKVGGQALVQPAERLTPSAKGRRPFLQPGNDDSVRHGEYQLVNASKPATAAATTTPTPEAALEFRLQLGELDARLKFAQARTEAYQQQVSRFEAYNQYAAPDTLSMLPSNVLPHSRSYSPVTALAPISLGPVASFAPRSTFSHVLFESRQRLQDSQLEVQALRATKERLVASGDSAAEAPIEERGVSYTAQLQEIQAELELEQFRAESARLREQQFDHWTVVGGLQSRSANPLQPDTVSPFSRTNLAQLNRLGRLASADLVDNLGSKIQLQRLEHELRVATLQEQGALIGEYLEASSQRPQELNVASERPKVQSSRQWAATTSN